MATWTKRGPSGSTTRRKWSIEDRASLKNLKYHFASDGCSDVQYDLARQLLESTSEIDELSSHSQGIHWLLCAAHQGHEGAIEKLRECYENRRGINDSNEDDVKTCLFMTNAERAARKAARELFACLSNDGEHITPAQLERKMRDIYKLQKSKRYRNNNNNNLNTDSQSSSDDDEIEQNKSQTYNDNNILLSSLPNRSSRAELDLPNNNLITEANLVTAAVNHSRGHMPRVSGVLTLSIPNPNSLDHVPCFHRILLHPIIFFTLLYHRFIKMISSFPGSSTLSNFKIIFLISIYALISSNEILTVLIPLILYYFSFLIMIWSTFKMLKTKHDFIDFRIWSGLFLSYGDYNINVDNSENRFLRNNMKPYLYFFFAFIVNLIIYPVISMEEWLLNSEITVTSFLMVFVTMFAFMYTSSLNQPLPDLLILLSFGINVLAKYPYETDLVVTTGWRFLDLKVPTFYSFVIGNGIEFCLNCRAILYLMIPVLMIYLAKRSNWHGTYTYFIPHCVTLSWLQICIISSKSATMFGLMRAVLGLAGIMLFLPLFGIVTLMIPIFLAIDWLGLTDPKVRIATSVTTALVALFGSCFLAVNQRTQKYITTLQIILCLAAAALLTLPYMTSNFKSNHSEETMFDGLLKINRKHIANVSPDDIVTSSISWEKFYSYCGQPAWDNLNKVKTQFRCSQLEGTAIKWEGIVQQVEITKISNYRKDLIEEYLPVWFGNFITCLYGDKNLIECNDNDGSINENCADIRDYLNKNKQCNLNRFNIYEYEIKIRMNSGILSRPGEVYLKACNFFGNFSAELKNSDRIWFSGTLLNSRRYSDGTTVDMVLGTGQPVVELHAIGCKICQNKNLNMIKIKTDSVFNSRIIDLMRGVKYLLNVLLNPLIIFK